MSVAAAGVALLFASQMIALHRTQGQVTKVQMQREAIRSVVRAASEDQTTVTKGAQTVRDLRAAPVPLSTAAALTELTRVLPQDAFLTTVYASRDTIVLEGGAVDIGRLTTALSASPLLSGLYLDSTGEAKGPPPRAFVMKGSLAAKPIRSGPAKLSALR